MSDSSQIITIIVGALAGLFPVLLNSLLSWFDKQNRASKTGHWQSQSIGSYFWAIPEGIGSPQGGQFFFRDFPANS